MIRRPAVFLDRDGTIIEAVHYLRDPAHVRLLPGAGESLAKLHQHGFACILVTNQSAIGRGLLTIEGFHQVQAELYRQLKPFGARLDACYFSPTVPQGTDRRLSEDPDRKPAPGMLHRASVDHHLDLARSWMIGDMVSDILAGRNAGCRDSVFVKCGQGTPNELEQIHCPIFEDFPSAVQHILNISHADSKK